MVKNNKEATWKPFIQFYTKFKIPWWLFIASMFLGILYAEISIKLVTYIIAIYKGELYNSTILGYALLSLLNACIVVFQIMASSYGAGIITLRARKVLWNKILHLPLKTIEEENPSSLVSGVTIDVAKASTTITMIFLLVSSVYGFIKACYVLFDYNSTLTTYLLFLVPLAIILFIIVGRLQFSMTRRQYGALNKMTAYFAEHLSKSKHVKAQVMEDKEIEEGYKIIDKKYKADIYYAFMYTAQTFIDSLYSNLATVVMCVGGSRLILEGKLESTGINNFSSYMSNQNRYLHEVLGQYQEVKGTQGILKHVNRILEMDEENIELGNSLEDGSRENDMIFRKVSFGYTSEKEVLHDLSFSIPRGKTTAIVGDNGSGKSTLLKLMQRFYEPTSGDILIGDTKISDLKAKEIRGQFGYVLQNVSLCSGTIKENIVYGLERLANDEEIKLAAIRADADNFIMSFQEGYDTDIGEGGSRLSGGQRQKISIARAIIQNPNWLLLDEACANLDFKSDAYILDSIRKVMKDKTVVMIAHDINDVIKADNIIVLNKGKLEAEGSHYQLLEFSPTYRLYVEKQGLVKEGVL